MKELHVLFSTPMVESILGGLKTQTRRIIKPQPIFIGEDFKRHLTALAPYQVGDRLWVRRPGIFMPKALARLWLTVTQVRVQRLQEISEEDAIAEGCTNRDCFRILWDSLNGKTHPWESNPFVWVYSFQTERKAEK